MDFPLFSVEHPGVIIVGIDCFEAYPLNMRAKCLEKDAHVLTRHVLDFTDCFFQTLAMDMVDFEIEGPFVVFVFERDIHPFDKAFAHPMVVIAHVILDPIFATDDKTVFFIIDKRVVP